MSTKTRCLAESAYVPNAEADIFVATVKTIIDKCSSVAVLAGNVTLRIVESGGAPADSHRQGYKAFAINDEHVWPSMVGQTLNVGDKIRGVCTVATAVTLRISGREITE